MHKFKGSINSLARLDAGIARVKKQELSGMSIEEPPLLSVQRVNEVRRAAKEDAMKNIQTSMKEENEREKTNDTDKLISQLTEHLKNITDQKNKLYDNRRDQKF